MLRISPFPALILRTGWTERIDKPAVAPSVTDNARLLKFVSIHWTGRLRVHVSLPPETSQAGPGDRCFVAFKCQTLVHPASNSRQTRLLATTYNGSRNSATTVLACKPEGTGTKASHCVAERGRRRRPPGAVRRLSGSGALSGIGSSRMASATTLGRCTAVSCKTQ